MTSKTVETVKTVPPYPLPKERHRFRALGTRHGVVIVDQSTGRYAWFYVFGGGYKLRWKSIINAVIDDGVTTITVHRKFPGALQIGTITADLHGGSYTETWADRTLTPVP